MSLTQRDRVHVFEKLRAGLVPERGIESFAVGIDVPRGEIQRQLEIVKSGEGAVKFLRAGYGCGKTFMSRLAIVDAQARGFATSFVVVSDNDLHFYRFDDVYRRVMTELGTAVCPRGALGDILDRWIARIENELMASGADENDAGFDGLVKQRLDEELKRLTGGKVPADFVRVVQAVFECKQRGQLSEAGALLSWLAGSSNVAASAKKVAGIKGDIESSHALDYLRGAVEIVRAAGYAGLVVVIDEAETILRMRTDSRQKSLNGIRQIVDAAGSYPGLLWVFTGTPDFYDSRRGVASLPPLHDRIAFVKQGRFASSRQAQLELVPFDRERLEAVAVRLRELYPAQDRARLEARISREFIGRLVDEVTTGFRGDVGVVPRQFLRAFVLHMDLVDEHPDYDPAKRHFVAKDLRPEEQQAISGAPGAGFDEGDEGDGPAPVGEVW